MTIRDLYRQKKPVFSLEVFPPKKENSDDIEALYGAFERLENLAPDFISVTCGAGGTGGKSQTVDIADRLQNRHGILSLAHLTCVAATRADVQNELADMHRRGIGNVLALRGDIPQGSQLSASPDYRYAEDLIRGLRASSKDLCIGAACYPEGHIDCDDLATGIAHLRRKQDAGADFFITQLFFDNEVFYRFLDCARASGITLPISAGIMPILSRAQIERIIFMCGASLPAHIIRLLHKYENSPRALRAAGIAYTAEQARALAEHGVDGVHIYTMNRPEIAEACARALGKA